MKWFSFFVFLAIIFPPSLFVSGPLCLLWILLDIYQTYRTRTPEELRCERELNEKISEIRYSIKIQKVHEVSETVEPSQFDIITPAQLLQRYGIKCFYHFTDTRNLPSIKASGGLLPLSKIKDIVVAPGGNKLSRVLDERNSLDKYVHLCFLPTHPMEYNAKKDGRILESRFLRIDTSIINTPGVLFYPDIANKTGVTPLSLEEAVKVMDFEIIATAHNHVSWLTPHLFNRKRIASKYEILIPDEVAISYIKGH